MEVQHKRKLLEAVDILVRRPAAANETTLAEALAYFKMLVEEVTQEEVIVHYVNASESDLLF
jgi:hypothetical protein